MDLSAYEDDNKSNNHDDDFSKTIQDSQISQEELEHFRLEVLNSHNEVRKNYHDLCPPMELDPTLNDMAQRWSHEMAKHQSFKHSPDEHRHSYRWKYIGENVYYRLIASDSEENAEDQMLSGEEVVKQWALEKDKYDPSRLEYQAKASNFTQMVWKISTFIGVGVSRCIQGRKAMFYVVVNYGPAGNAGEEQLYEDNLNKLENISTPAPTPTEENPEPIIKTLYDCPYSEQEVRTFVEEIVTAHNQVRARHGVPPLTLHDQLNKMAQIWVDNLSNLNKMKHSSEEHRVVPNEFDYVGENIYYKQKAFKTVGEAKKYTVGGKFPVDGWYSEIQFYNFKNPDFYNKAGHFTQVIWRETTHMGVGIQRKIQGRRANVMVVVNYGTGGNFGYPEDYARNVPPLQSTEAG